MRREFTDQEIEEFYNRLPDIGFMIYRERLEMLAGFLNVDINDEEEIPALRRAVLHNMMEEEELFK